MATKTVKRTELATFNDNITTDHINELITAYSNLSKSTAMSFSWGTDLGIEGLNHGYTYAFESTFASKDGLKVYLASDAFAKFNNDQFVPCLKHRLVMDYFLN